MTIGQLSADGQWQWDGTRWVPANQALAPMTAYPPPLVVRMPPTNSLAVVSLVTGIISWFLCPIIGALVAVITGHMARGQIRASGESGGGLAMAGLVLGYIHLVVAGLVTLLWLFLLGGLVALFGAAASSGH